MDRDSSAAGTKPGKPGTQRPRRRGDAAGYSPKLAGELMRRRLALGLSQDEVRLKAGLGSQNQVSMLERNTIDKPSMEDLVKLGKVYGMTPNELAETAGWWQPPATETRVPSALQEIAALLPTLSEASQRQLLETCRKLLDAFQTAEREGAGRAKLQG